ncbi:Retrotransposon-derived protein PEG10 [Mycena sanguinolenta]|uniref:Retrotransposon-derived protein PEG10 n=1 Tax=Mycena sanguinolenta TaxID=230812 RepID=A0A8H7CK24_9AGAR|nr:Retrotransposon-derived protein PEG10 [Mycena sanguinolenta]
MVLLPPLRMHLLLLLPLVLPLLLLPRPVVPTPTTAAPAPVPVAPRPLKGREPRLFTGSTKDVEAFIDEVETNIRLQRMTDDLDKTGYFSTYLKDGNPKSWYYSVKATDMSLLSDYPRFVASFRSQFSDSNYAATALRQIKALRQTGSCANYAARFRELLAHVDFSEQTKLDQFCDGLKSSVRDKIVGVRPKPTAFEAFVTLAIEIDNDLHENEIATRERAGGSRSTANSSRPNHHLAVSSPPASSSTSDPTPMEVDSLKFRGPLTQDEKDHRRRNNLCLYCGGPGHDSGTCPNKSAKAKKRCRARQAGPAQAGKA